MLINGLCRFLLLSLMGMDNDYDDNYVPWQKHSPFSGSNALRVSLSLPLFINRRSYIHKSDGKWYRTVKMSDNFSTTQWYCYVFIDVHASNIQLYADFFDKHNANKSLISPRVLVRVRVCVVVWCNCMNLCYDCNQNWLPMPNQIDRFPCSSSMKITWNLWKP